MTRFLYTLLLGVLPLAQTFAQDVSFSQFYANRAYLNPAFVGMEKGLQFGVASRLQWYQVDRGYRTMAGSLEWQEPCINFGFGLNVFHVEEGLFNYSTTSIGLQFAKIIPGERHNVHIGFSPRFVFRSFDDDNLIFSDQLDPVFGAVNPTGFVLETTRTAFPDADVGAVWRFDGKTRDLGNRIRSARYSLGFSLHHLFGLFLDSPTFNESLLGLNTPVTPRLTLHGGVIIPTTILQGRGQRFALSPNFKFDMQGARLLAPGTALRTLSLGSYVLINGFYLGGFYQSRSGLPTARADTEIMSFMAGWYFNQPGTGQKRGDSYLIGFNMDVNLSGIGSGAGNVYELAIRYRFDSFRPLFCRTGPLKAKNILDCEDFY